MYALQLALITDEYCEPQAPGELPGPDPNASHSEELGTQSSSHDDIIDALIARVPLHTGRPMASW